MLLQNTEIFDLLPYKVLNSLSFLAIAQSRQAQLTFPANRSYIECRVGTQLELMCEWERWRHDYTA
jgi:hypothetical protein